MDSKDLIMILLTPDGKGIDKKADALIELMANQFEKDPVLKARINLIRNQKNGRV